MVSISNVKTTSMFFMTAADRAVLRVLTNRCVSPLSLQLCMKRPKFGSDRTVMIPIIKMIIISSVKVKPSYFRLLLFIININMAPAIHAPKVKKENPFLFPSKSFIGIRQFFPHRFCAPNYEIGQEPCLRQVGLQGHVLGRRVSVFKTIQAMA